MSTLLLLCLCIVLGCVCYVMYVTFTAETRRLNRIIDHLESTNFTLKSELFVVKADLDEAEESLNEKWDGRLERHTVICH